VLAIEARRGSVGPGFAYRRVMTFVVSDDDLDWEFVFDSYFGHPTGSFFDAAALGVAHFARQQNRLSAIQGTTLLDLAF
jgi:hypothetical protein